MSPTSLPESFTTRAENPYVAAKREWNVKRPRFVRHRIESYAASAADESWFCRMAAGV